MVDTSGSSEYFLRLEVYFKKGFSGYWPLIVDSLAKLSRHISTSHHTEVYEDFNLTLFHEEELEEFLHASLHFSKLSGPSVVDSIVDEVLETSEFVEAYLTIKGNVESLQKLGREVYVEGISIRVLTYPDKGIATMAYRLLKPNRGVHPAKRVLSKATMAEKGLFEGLRRLLSFKR